MLKWLRHSPPLVPSTRLMSVGDAGNDGILLGAADGKVPPRNTSWMGNDNSKSFILCEKR